MIRVAARCYTTLGKDGQPVRLVLDTKNLVRIRRVGYFTECSPRASLVSPLCRVSSRSSCEQVLAEGVALQRARHRRARARPRAADGALRPRRPPRHAARCSRRGARGERARRTRGGEGIRHLVKGAAH